MPVIYQRPLVRQFIASRTSSGGIFHLLCLLLLVILPYLICFSSRGFWKKENTLIETPTVHFKHKVLLVAEGTTAGSTLAWSTIPGANLLLGSSLRAADISSYENDTSVAGRPDKITITASLPVAQGESIHRVRALFFFSCQFKDLPISLEAIADVQHESVVPGKRCVTEAELRLRQRYQLPWTPHSLKPISESAYSLADLSPESILSEYSARDFRIDSEPLYTVWNSGLWGNVGRFELQATFHINPQHVWYRPSFFEVLKYAWVQYLCVAFVLHWLLRALQSAAFDKQIVDTYTRDEVMVRNDSSTVASSNNWNGVSFAYAQRHPHHH